jgi:hypothetical protein
MSRNKNSITYQYSWINVSGRMSMLSNYLTLNERSNFFPPVIKL